MSRARYPRDGATLVLRLTLQAVLFSGIVPVDGHLSAKTERAPEIARALGLEQVAAGAKWSWWASAEAIVLQSQGTRAVALTKKASVTLGEIDRE